MWIILLRAEWLRGLLRRCLKRGQDGQTITYKNAREKLRVQKWSTEPKQGDEFKTTIDFDLQEYFYKSMLKGLNSIGKTSGVGIAINPLTGEVLSLISLPAFDPNNLSAPLWRQQTIF